jgi:GNAT superfamily N-acetyltransferase
MKAKTLNIDGCRISIRLMDASYIMCEDEGEKNVVVDVSCRHMSRCWPNPLYSTYYRKLLEAYGIGPVLVREGERIIGFMPVSVVNCGVPELPHCIHYTGGINLGAERHIDLAMVEKGTSIPFAELQAKEIRIGCMSVHPKIRGKNMAALMIQYIIDWAGEHGWDRVRARAMLDNEPLSFYPAQSYWQRLGFKQSGPVRTFGPSKDPVEQSKAVDLIFDLKK